MANEKTGVLQFQLSDGTYVAGYPKTILSQVIGGQDAIDQAKSDAVTEALEKAGVKTYAAGTAYHANALVADGSNLYLVLKDFTASHRKRWICLPRMRQAAFRLRMQTHS